jgi:hypothetical protein
MDIKENAMNGLKGACGMFLQDLEALPEDAFDRSFGPATRTVADIVYEINLVNDHIGTVLRGEEPFAWPEGKWIKAPEGFRSKDVVIDAFKRSTEKFLATAEAFSPEQMEETVKTEWGERSRFQRCQFVALHLWYHSGQLNFIQTMLGDDEMHWS